MQAKVLYPCTHAIQESKEVGMVIINVSCLFYVAYMSLADHKGTQRGRLHRHLNKLLALFCEVMQILLRYCICCLFFFVFFNCQ